jgi:hypothetical protein
MGMVFCRGCGKEIHETAPTCPHCGAPQNIPSMIASKRSVGKLIAMAVVWTIVFWIGSLMAAGGVAGVLNPHDASGAGARIGEAFSGIFFLISLCLSIVLTIFGKLPGTKKS